MTVGLNVKFFTDYYISLSLKLLCLLCYWTGLSVLSRGSPGNRESGRNIHNTQISASTQMLWASTSGRKCTAVALTAVTAWLQAWNWRPSYIHQFCTAYSGPGHSGQQAMRDSPYATRDMYTSSISWVCPVVSSWLDGPGTPPQGIVQ